MLFRQASGIAISLGKVILATFSLATSLFFLLLPMRARTSFAFFTSNLFYFIFKRSDFLYQLTYQIKSVGKEEAMHQMKSRKVNRPKEKMKTESAAVLFSGGSDSTLSAALLLNEFKKVYLLTYEHSAIPNASKSNISAQRLQEIYGRNRVFHEIIDIDQILKEIYDEAYLHDLKKYRAFQVNFCAACKLAMYMATLAYCLEKYIHFVASGANKDGGDLLADQMPTISDEVKSLFRRHGIIYTTPVYDIDRTDWELFRLGITRRKNTKIRAMRQGTLPIQAYCEHAFPLTLYAKGYFVPLYGQRSLEEKSLKWYQEKIVKYEKKLAEICFRNVNEKESSRKIAFFKRIRSN